jgi:hypothetical protein
MTLFQLLYLRHRALGYSRGTSLRLARWCLDDSPAPGWTHKEQMQ